MKQTWTMLIDLLSEYVSLNTSYPNPLYEPVFSLFEKQAAFDGLKSKKIDLPSKKFVLVISLEGSDQSLPSLALSHHMDVVPVADASLWKHDPFKGVCEQEILYGRGTQDAKGLGVVHYQALVAFKNQYGIPKRTIHLLFVPDEEIGGVTGVGQLVETKEFAKLNIGFVVDEGLPSGDEQALLIKVSERKPLQICITAIGKSAHAALLLADNPIHRLTAVLVSFNQLHENQKELAKKDATPLGLLLSAHVTMIQAGIMATANVIPDVAKAYIDVRIPPTMSVQKVYKQLQAFISQFSGVTIDIIAQAEDILPHADQNSELFLSLSAAVADCGLHVQVHYAQEASDLRFYWNKKITGFGLTPFTVTPNLHGVNESVRVKDLKLGFDIMYAFLKRFCL